MEPTASTPSAVTGDPRERLLARMLGGRATGNRPESAALHAPSPLDGAPLSYGQQRLWFLDSVDTTGSEYVVPTVLSLQGRLNVAALQTALSALMNRHDVLRSRIDVQEGIATQRVIPMNELPLSVTDLRSTTQADRAALAMELTARFCGRPFDLIGGPMLRAAVLRLGDDEWWLIICVHHIAFDGGSRRVLLRDLAGFYADATHPGASDIDTAHAMSKPSLSYADFAIAQRQRVESGTLADRVDGWRQRLAANTPLNLPFSRVRPPLRDSRGGLVCQQIDRPLVAAVERVAAARSATPFMVCLAAYALLLGRYSRQPRFAIATPSDGRDNPGLRDVVGFFVNTLAIPIQVAAAGTFADLVDQVRDTVLAAIPHPQVPFEYLVDLLAPVRDPSRTPLCQVMLVWEDGSGGVLPPFAGLAAKEVEFDRGIAKFDLTLAIRPDRRTGGADLALQYATSLFDRATAEEVLTRWRHVLGQVTSDEHAPLGRAQLLTETERKDAYRLQSRPVALSTRSLDSLAAIQAIATPDGVAVQDDRNRLTFAELADRAATLAVQLRLLGVGPGTVVGVHLRRSCALPVSLLAVLQTGGAFLPLDPDLPAARLAYMCADSGARVVLTEGLGEELADALPENAIVHDVAGGEWAPAHDPLRGPLSLDDVAYIIYTSGSTGRPKGVAVSHRAILNRLEWMRVEFAVDSRDVILHKTPISFDVSLWELLLPLVTGARLLIARPGGHLEPAYLAQTMALGGVTIVHFVPPMLRAFLAEDHGVELTALRHLICSGEQLDASLAARFRARFAAAVHNLYGPTEASIDVTAHKYAGGSEGSVPIGTAVANTQVYVADEGLRLVPAGVPGELLLGGVQLAQGYVGLPGLTAERFVPDLYGPPGGRLFRSGDLVRRLPRGELEFISRLDRQIKIRGMRVEPGETEAALIAQPGVGACVVAPRPGPSDESWLVAWAVPLPGAGIDVPATLAALRAALPAYLVPSALVVIAGLPVTANGKIDLASLPSPGPDSTGGSGGVKRKPVGKVEQTLACIWAESLGVPEVSATDNFFDLGGNSLLAVLVTMRVRQELHRSLPVSMLMQHPTIAELAAASGDETALRRYGSLVPLRAGGRQRPMFFVHSHGGHVFVYQQVAHYLAADRPVYALRARGLDDGEPPFDRLPEMAAHYLELIRRVQPRGPYALAGWCLGGAVAYEMAQQLRGQGEEVDVLGIISLSAVQEMPDWEANDDVAFLGFVLAGFLPDLADLPGLVGHENVPLDLPLMRSLGLDAQLDYVMRLAREHKVLRPDVDTPKEARQLFEVYRAHRTAILNYTLSPYDGPVVLFKAELNHLPDSPEGDLGWGRLARGGLTIHEIPGTHFQLLQEPNVRLLAAALESHLGEHDTALA